jgi:hypothetical protein
VPYAEGTLVIDLRDTSVHSMVWCGIASEEKSDPAQIQKKLDEMVRKASRNIRPRDRRTRPDFPQLAICLRGNKISGELYANGGDK